MHSSEHVHLHTLEEGNMEALGTMKLLSNFANDPILFFVCVCVEPPRVPHNFRKLGNVKKTCDD